MNTWATSKDAVPEGYTQVTVYDEVTGDRIATVFDAEAVPLIEAAPDMLAALELALATIERLKPPSPYDSTQGTRDVINAALTKASA